MTSCPTLCVFFFKYFLKLAHVPSFFLAFFFQYKNSTISHSTKAVFAVLIPSTLTYTQTGQSSQMHTITLIVTIASLLLPLLTTAQAPRWRPKHWPASAHQPYYMGDMLNVTKCYCESATAHNIAGSYYQFDYRNFHTAQEYSLSWSCDSSKTTTGFGRNGHRREAFSLPVCWNGHDAWRDEKKAMCVKSYNADTFCFELGNKHEPYDHYYYNGQKRGLPDYGIQERTPLECVDLCRDKVGGRTVASKCTF